jgi:uncharacterized membrane protein HdeD (DUF308 family)
MTAGTVSAEGQVVPWWLVLLQGIAAIIIGVLLLTSPGATVAFLVLVLGFYWLISGIFSIISIFIDKSQWGWKLFMGILGILAGIIVIQHPLVSTLVIPTFAATVVGVMGIIMGVIGLIQAFQGGGWGVGVLGVLSIIFGILILANPMISAVALVIVLGVFGIVGGILGIIAAFQMK